MPLSSVNDSVGDIFSCRFGVSLDLEDLLRSETKVFSDGIGYENLRKLSIIDIAFYQQIIRISSFHYIFYC